MPHDRDQNLSDLHEWIAAISPELGIAPEDIPVGAILDLSKTVAHGVTRPGVPVTAFLAGLAAGQGKRADEVLTDLTSRAEHWKSRATA
ncbi:MAG TPA: hypothetical protein GXZ30_01340 [Propionibacterium sp.]|jgi:hypothetical protein|nr:hypothetical protein [Propionibacterium sp.]